MRITQTQPAEPNDRFTATAFDSQIGKPVALRVNGVITKERIVLVGAKVSDDGTAAELTWEVPDAAPGAVRSYFREGDFSLG